MAYSGSVWSLSIYLKCGKRSEWFLFLGQSTYHLLRAKAYRPTSLISFTLKEPVDMYEGLWSTLHVSQHAYQLGAVACKQGICPRCLSWHGGAMPPIVQWLTTYHDTWLLKPWMNDCMWTGSTIVAKVLGEKWKLRLQELPTWVKYTPLSCSASYLTHFWSSFIEDLLHPRICRWCGGNRPGIYLICFSYIILRSKRLKVDVTASEW